MKSKFYTNKEKKKKKSTTQNIHGNVSPALTTSNPAFNNSNKIEKLNKINKNNNNNSIYLTIFDSSAKKIKN